MTKPVIRAIPSYAEVVAAALPVERAEAAERFSAEGRRAEWLAWRSVVRELVCADGFTTEDFRIVYNECGAPEVRRADNSQILYYIGVSHCRGRVAVVVSAAPCGVDVEWADRNFERASSRYISTDERALEQHYPERMSGAVWCAKEAVYKYFSAQGVKYPDFLNDIRVVASDLSRGVLRVAAGADSLVDVRVEWTSEGLIVASVGV